MYLHKYKHAKEKSINMIEYRWWFRK